MSPSISLHWNKSAHIVKSFIIIFIELDPIVKSRRTSDSWIDSEESIEKLKKDTRYSLILNVNDNNFWSNVFRTKILSLNLIFSPDNSTAFNTFLNLKKSLF